MRQSRLVAWRWLIAGVLVFQLQPSEAADPPSPPTSPPPEASATQHFDVREYRVLGNTVLSDREIEGVLYPRLGESKTLTDVDAARAALEAAYHAAGYATVFVDVPPQKVDEGIVRLRVTEGRLRNRSISGARYFSEREILAQLPATTPGTVPKISELQQQLNAVNTQTPDRSVVPILKAGSEPGTTDLTLKVDDHLPLHGSVDLNNQYTPDTRHLRANFGLSYNNLFQDLDSISLQYTTTPQATGEVGVVNTGYAFHPIDGLRPSISFTNSSSNVATLGTLGVLGKGQVYSARLSAPIAQLPGDSQTLTVGLDYKSFRNAITVASIGEQVEPVSYVNLSLTYSGAWQRFNASQAVEQFGSLDLTFDAGPRGIANRTSNFGSGALATRGNYAYLRSGGSFSTRLPADFLLTLRGTGQVALEKLVVYEQESFTGADGVRGYLDAEVLGDTGIKGSVQLQSMPFSRKGFIFADGFFFFDAGRSHLIQALPGEPGRTDLRSWGAGLDLFPGHAITGSLTWAEPLVSGPRTEAHEYRVLFDLKGSF